MPRSDPEPERAAEDLLLDCGGGLYTVVIKDDVIPPALANLPRLPRTPPPAQAHPAGRQAGRQARLT